MWVSIQDWDFDGGLRNQGWGLILGSPSYEEYNNRCTCGFPNTQLAAGKKTKTPTSQHWSQPPPLASQAMLLTEEAGPKGNQWTILDFAGFLLRPQKKSRRQSGNKVTLCVWNRPCDTSIRASLHFHSSLARSLAQVAERVKYFSAGAQCGPGFSRPIHAPANHRATKSGICGRKRGTPESDFSSFPQIG